MEPAMVESAIENPDLVEPGYHERKIAQKTIDAEHVLRVVFEDLPDRIRMITFYPGRRKRYEN